MMYRFLLLLLLLLRGMRLAAKAPAAVSVDTNLIRPAILAHVREVARTDHWIPLGFFCADKEDVGDSCVSTAPLCREATNVELILLTEWPKGNVRGLAIQCLMNRKSPAGFPALLRHLYDNEKIYVLDLENWQAYRVGDLLLESSGLSPAQQATVDSLLRFDSNLQLEAVDKWLVDQPLGPEYYRRAREWAAGDSTVERTGLAAIALAAYRRPEDRRLIRRVLESPWWIVQRCGLEAVRHFPDSTFFPVIKALHAKALAVQDRSILYEYNPNELYHAIVSYQDAPSRDLLLQTLTMPKGKTRELHLWAMWRALSDNPAPIYQSLPDWQKWMEAVQKQRGK